MKYSKLFLVVSFFVALISCNKDEVIEIEGDGNSQQGGFRPSTPFSNAYIDRVYEWTPAPGQYINDFGSDFPDAVNISPSQAAAWALERLKNNFYVSLGAFGGYMVAGFDHSVKNIGDYEIGVLGNAFLSVNGNSNEPGIVYVMKDENLNGLPDDTWYELKGSDTFSPGTVRDYAVTYYRPQEDGQPVMWKDNLGNTGYVDYLGAFHSQPTYYPLWVEQNEYTLAGTCLEAKTIKNPDTGNWENPPFGWGYADNIGKDNFNFAGFNNCNRFKISDAINVDGQPVSLDYIDFVKIQTGVFSQAGWLGEVSTEVLGILDLTLE